MVHSIHHLFFGSEEALSITHTIMVALKNNVVNVKLVAIEVCVKLRNSTDYMPFKIM